MLYIKSWFASSWLSQEYNCLISEIYVVCIIHSCQTVSTWYIRVREKREGVPSVILKVRDRENKVNNGDSFRQLKLIHLIWKKTSWVIRLLWNSLFHLGWCGDVKMSLQWIRCARQDMINV